MICQLKHNLYAVYIAIMESKDIHIFQYKKILFFKIYFESDSILSIL
jgi:hypothetical protein